MARWSGWDNRSAVNIQVMHGECRNLAKSNPPYGT
jgi:hypothetical protein